MTQFRDWLDRVLNFGESVQDTPPEFPPVERQEVESLLRVAFNQSALDICGPPIAFEPDTAVRAACFVARACWLLVGADESEPETLAFTVESTAPSTHLSADIVLRFVPAIYRRVRMRQPDGVLATELERLLRAWPLTGVLADLDGEPTTTLEFGGHPGLQLLYAERLVEINRPGWVPPSGMTREWVDRVFYERGKRVPSLTIPEEVRSA